MRILPDSPTGTEMGVGLHSFAFAVREWDFLANSFKVLSRPVTASAEDGDVPGKEEGPGQGRREAGADIAYVEGRETQRVEFRYHRRRD